MIYRHWIVIFFCAFSIANFAQNKENTQDSLKTEVYKPVVMDPLAPSKAAFYSAILPGLGQAVNKKYWKIPIVYAALGTSIYLYMDNDRNYKRYRKAYKRRLSGFTDDEFYGEGSIPLLSNEALIRAQQTLRRNKELSLLITIGLYALNIIDANVDAHLLQYNVDKNLAVNPFVDFDTPDTSAQLGLSINFNF
ncbi:MAG: DUF5683 domain-containing protein [Flavobacteriaceae bacterium]|nr:hypothetical protein [Formosa sp.]MDG1374939.1 DUF5683 domain-containing protein [Flavobacteriaceae bacterium]MDG2499266.1 DUF5683 domain-containing protein [Flavobacteriaceae bacterium]